MPRRRKVEGSGAAAPKVERKEVRYLLTTAHQAPAEFACHGFGADWHCGCPTCRPDYWCAHRNASGERCPLPGKKWPQAPDVVLCYQHVREEVSRRNLEALMKAKAS